MRLPRRAALLGATLAAIRPAAAENELLMIDNVELTGLGAPAGAMWKMGLDLAAAEINAADGIFGRRIALQHIDNESQPGTAQAIAARVAAIGPYVTFGPVYSASVNATMTTAEKQQIPMFMGGEAASLTMRGNPYLFRTSLTQLAGLPKIAAYMAANAIHSVAMIYTGSEAGTYARDALRRELANRQIVLAADIPTQPGQTDLSRLVTAAQQARADALFVWLDEPDSVRLLTTARRLRYDRPIYGEAILASPRVLELAGPAANGVRAHIGLSPDAALDRVQDFAARFQAAHRQTPDANAMKSYIALQLVRLVTERMRAFDRHRLTNLIHGQSFTADAANGLLLDLSYDANGDLDRDSYLVEIRDGRPEILETLPALGRR